MNIGELCNRDVVVANRTDAILAIARLMRQYHVGTVVVVANGRPLGMITDRDIVLEIVAGDVPLEGCTAGDMMSQAMFTVTETTGVYETLQVMKSKGVRRVPVVDDGGTLVGIFSSDDAIEFVAEQMGGLVSLIGRERQHEAAARP